MMPGMSVQLHRAGFAMIGGPLCGSPIIPLFQPDIS
jgi:hypothetical protein